MASQSAECRSFVPSAPRPSSPVPQYGPARAQREADEKAQHRLPRFRVTAGRFGGIDGVMLIDVPEGAHVILAQRGATLLDWCVPFGGGMLSLTDGYRSRIELFCRTACATG